MSRRLCCLPTVRDERGFTLIEVMAAATILVVALIPILLMFITSSKSTAKADYHSVGLNLAQARLEELRDVPYASVVSVNDPAIIVDGKTFARTVTVTTPETNLKQVVVVVSWTDAAGARSVSLSTYRANY